MRKINRKGLILALLAGSALALAVLYLWTSTWRDRDPQPALPIRAAFYYPWYPENWGKGPNSQDTVYTPSLGRYRSADADVIRAHIAAMQYGNISAGILSWWGKDTPTNHRVPTILAATAGSSFRWAIYYEKESIGDPAAADIRADLTYLRDRFSRNLSYLRIDGRFVVFVYTDGDDDCAMAHRWSEANAGINAYIVLRVFRDYQDCAAQPDGWHQYAPANPVERQGSYSYTISPGFYKRGEAAERLTRDLERWRRNVRDMIASKARFQLITSFNEWHEGTAIEPAGEWASPSGYGIYLDALHEDGVDVAQSP